MHCCLVSLIIISSCESLSSPLRELAVLERTPESITTPDIIGVYVSTMTTEIFFVPKPSTEARWNITFERQRVGFAVTV